MKRAQIITLLLTALVFSSCQFDCISGEGEVTKIEKDISDFDQIELQGSGSVILTKSNRFKFSFSINCIH